MLGAFDFYTIVARYRDARFVATPPALHLLDASEAIASIASAGIPGKIR